MSGTAASAVSLSSLQAATAGQWMRQNGISVVRTRKHKVTTDSNHKFNIAPNLLDRNFSAERPNQKWAGPSRDIALQCTVRQWTSAMFGRVRVGCISR